MKFGTLFRNKKLRGWKKVTSFYMLCPTPPIRSLVLLLLLDFTYTDIFIENFNMEASPYMNANFRQNTNHWKQ